MAKSKTIFSNIELHASLADAEKVLSLLENAAALIPAAEEVTRDRLNKAYKAHNDIVFPMWMSVAKLDEVLKQQPIRSVSQKLLIVGDYHNGSMAMTHRVRQYVEALKSVLEMKDMLNARKPLWFETNGFNTVAAYDVAVHKFWCETILDFFKDVAQPALLATRVSGDQFRPAVRDLLLVVNAIRATARGKKKAPAPIAETTLRTEKQWNDFAAMLRRSVSPSLQSLTRKLAAR